MSHTHSPTQSPRQTPRSLHGRWQVRFAYQQNAEHIAEVELRAHREYVASERAARAREEATPSVGALQELLFNPRVKTSGAPPQPCPPQGAPPFSSAAPGRGVPPPGAPSAAPTQSW